VSSCKKLCVTDADAAIKILQSIAVEKGVWNEPGTKHEYRGAQFAAPNQLRKIEAMWADVSYVKDFNKRKAALEKLLLNKFDIGKLEWVKRTQVSKIIRMLKNMRERQAAE
jgi:hypothetical protein